MTGEAPMTDERGDQAERRPRTAAGRKAVRLRGLFGGETEARAAAWVAQIETEAAAVLIEENRRLREALDGLTTDSFPENCWCDDGYPDDGFHTLQCLQARMATGVDTTYEATLLAARAAGEQP